MRHAVTGLIVLWTIAGGSAAYSADTGPVVVACKVDRAKFCADKLDGTGQVRACLDANKDKVSAECKAALDAHGPGGGQSQK